VVKSFVVIAIIAALGGTPLLFAQSIARSQPNDYSDPKSWLCRPPRRLQLAVNAAHSSEVGFASHQTGCALLHSARLQEPPTI
jgi:hypothetical protein